ncbi:Ldh family oxidoreductase [Amycolatopsis suaedae]|uniref:Ldh family oxidoreductase n=1 Tax=Amycolatopsis suaedae TaxID=2510978 RepID=A0A4Q7JDK0_9PSEU|nr:Ldh family oxidoreductase [Amycolatopsis suaedae]RZQ64713.1 hypothetical protein EWH70_07420 [Amycolatopsis suaedae]
MGDADVLISAGHLRQVGTEILEAVGTGHEDAVAVAGSLVRADLRGHEAHGVRRLPGYVRAVREGGVDPTAAPESERPSPGTVVVYGNRAFGQLAAAHAVRELCVVAAQQGSGVAVIRDPAHVGRLGEYVAALADLGLVAMAFGSAASLAWAVPRGTGQPPVVLDRTDHADPGLGLLTGLAGGLAGTGMVLQAVDIAALDLPERFREQVERLCRERGTVPGDREERAARERERAGIPLPRRTWEELTALRG